MYEVQDTGKACSKYHMHVDWNHCRFESFDTAVYYAHKWLGIDSPAYILDKMSINSATHIRMKGYKKLHKALCDENCFVYDDGRYLQIVKVEPLPNEATVTYLEGEKQWMVHDASDVFALCPFESNAIKIADALNADKAKYKEIPVLSAT